MAPHLALSRWRSSASNSESVAVSRSKNLRRPVRSSVVMDPLLAPWGGRLSVPGPSIHGTPERSPVTSVTCLIRAAAVRAGAAVLVLLGHLLGQVQRQRLADRASLLVADHHQAGEDLAEGALAGRVGGGHSLVKRPDHPARTVHPDEPHIGRTLRRVDPGRQLGAVRAADLARLHP